MATPAAPGNGAASSGAVVVTTDVETTALLPSPSSPLIGAGLHTDEEGTSVFELVHTLHATITAAIDTPMTWEELKSPSVNYTLVKPIVERFKPTDDDEDDNDGHSLGGVLYAIFANRVQFINLADDDLSYAPLQNSRALFCELLAIKILRTSPTVQDEAELCSELVRSWSALEGAPDSVIAAIHDGDKLLKTRTSALDLAIVSGSKKFLSQPLVQHLITLIYDGDLIYSPVSSHALIADSLSNPAPRRRRRGAHHTNTEEDDEDENQPVEVYAYNPYKAGWLDYQRLRVPKWRRWIEFLSLTILITLFLLTLSTRHVRHPIHFTTVEILFIAFTFGFALDEFAASKEHGLSVYLASVWNTFDLAFIVIFLTYLFLRLRSLATHDPATADLGYDILSLGACLLFPRLAFILIQDNVVLLALRGMIATFFSFMALIAIAFSGIFFCLWTMGKDNQVKPITSSRIFGLMFSTWFGGSSSVFGFERVPPEQIHPVLGPSVLFAYALLCGLFLVPMLTSLLSNKFSAVRSNAGEESLFQRVVTTVEGVKSDAIFSYLPPFNIAALIILLPLGEFADAQTLHSVNVFLIRLTNFPLLFLISSYERTRYRALRRAVRLGERGVHPEYKNSWTDTFLGGGAQSVIRAAFEVAPPVVKQETPSAESPSKAGADVKPSKDALAAKNGKDKAAPAPLTLAPSKAASTRGLESPLGRLFRQERSESVTVSAEEWAEVRDSQKRLEDMLEKVLAVTGAAK